MPNINEKYKAFLRGDPAVVNEFNSPDFQRGWREKLRQTGRPWDPQADKDNGHNLPWTGQYIPNHQNHEDVSALVKAEKIVPGSGLLVSPLRPVATRLWTVWLIFLSFPSNAEPSRITISCMPLKRSEVEPFALPKTVALYFLYASHKGLKLPSIGAGITVFLSRTCLHFLLV